MSNKTDLLASKFIISTPNVFKHVNGDEITLEVIAKDIDEATEKFYTYLMEEFNYEPDLISIKRLQR